MKTTLRCGILTAIVALFVLGISAAHAAPTATGTFVTPNASGTIKFTAVKTVARLGSQGNFNVNGKGYPGMIYVGRPAGTGLVWYYGNTGIMAANALLFPQADGTFSGQILFFDKRGNVTDTGTATMVFR